MATYNEFQRELRERGIDVQNAYMFTLVYERLLHMANEIDNCAKATLALAETVKKVVELHEVVNNRLNQLRASRDDFLVQSEDITKQ